MNAFLTEELLHKKSSQEITALLYEACIDKLENAKLAIQEKNFADANKYLQRSNDILYRLGAGLNYEAGIIADQLEALYDYMANRLIEANQKKDISAIQEVLNILTDISSSWNVAMQERMDKQTPVMKQTARAYDQNSAYEK